jgi:hypothetical protein
MIIRSPPTHPFLLLLLLSSSSFPTVIRAASVRRQQLIPSSEAIVCTPCVHGTRIGDSCLGDCQCFNNTKWSGKDCNTCLPNWLGNDCQYSDELTCNNHGTVDDAGACACHHGWMAGGKCDSCAVGFKGKLCQFSNLETCNDHGIVDEHGKCACSGNWGGARCSSCISDEFKGSDCQFSNNLTCHGHGHVSESGVCSCDDHYGGGLNNDTNKDPFCEKCTPPWVGDKCQYSDGTNCFGRGSVDFLGKCHCYPQWRGNDNCTQCTKGYAGIWNNCEYSDVKDCSNHGKVSGNGDCECDQKWEGEHCNRCTAPWKGDKCQYSDETHCSNHGEVCSATLVGCNHLGERLKAGTCKCRHHWSGLKCDVCSENGAAVSGDDCQYSDLIDCTGHGIVNMNGTCKCRNNWSGNNCQICPHGFAGEDCQYSDKLDCSNHGVVHSTSKCTCRNDWSGNKCEICPIGHNGLDCQYSDKIDCNNNGIVNIDGKCNCFSNWRGNEVCTMCTPSGAHEARGPKCQFTRAETCNNHGTPVYAVDKPGFTPGFPSLCMCDDNYWGANCRLTIREYQLNCVAVPSRDPTKCCGSIPMWPAMAPTEEERLGDVIQIVRNNYNVKTSGCDYVWGVWRTTDATKLTGRPKFSGVRTKEGWVIQDEVGGGGDGSSSYNFNHYDVHYYYK